MQKAIQQAKLALQKGEVPVGAVIVGPTGEILSRAHNNTEKQKTQLAHAEVLAIKKACKKIGNWRLNGCWMYVTLEPCLMCLGLIQLSRLEGIVFGSKSTLFGAGLSDIRKTPSYAKNIQIIGGVQEKECLNLLALFFKVLRRKKGET